MSVNRCVKENIIVVALHCICHYRQGIYFSSPLISCRTQFTISHLANNVKILVWRTPCPSEPGHNLFFQTVPLRIVTTWPTVNAPVMVWEPWTPG